MKRSDRWVIGGPILAGGVGVIVAIVIAVVGVAPEASPSTAMAVAASLTIAGAPEPISPYFYGMGLRGDIPAAEDSDTLLAQTPVTYLRYPDGAIGERMDLVNGTVYTPGYSNSSRAVENVTDFISLCGQIDCHAIIQLPLEIDNPGTAAYEVFYIEKTLDFHPSFWELGNEPATWDCWGTPWVDWGTGCVGGTNPDSFANETREYISAIRAVDPSALFVGLGGTGQGNSDDASWIEPLERVNGPNLTAISIHSYADDHLSTEVATVSDFLAGLTAEYSLTNVVNQAREAVQTACPNCSTQVFVTEMDSVSGGRVLSGFLDTFYNGLFYGAEVAQGLNDRVANIDPFSWENGFLTSAGPTARYVVESEFLTLMGSEAYEAAVNISGVFAVLTQGPAGLALLLVNANATSNVDLQIAQSAVHWNGTVQELAWTASEEAPSASILPSLGGMPWIEVPSCSLVLVRGVGSVLAG